VQRLFWDRSEVRASMWEVLQLKPWNDRAQGAGPTFLVVHSSHVAEEIRSHNPEWSSAQEFEASVRTNLGPTAILYISGAQDPRDPQPDRFSRLDIPSDDPWTHVHVGSLLRRDVLFEERLQKVLTDWERHDGAEPPKWSLLGDPLAEVLDYLAGLGLVVHDLEKHRGYVASHSLRFKQASSQLQLTEEEQKTLSRAAATQGDTQTSMERLDEAIKLIRGFAPSAGRALTSPELHPRERLEAERVRISHDLFQNRFGGVLLPGWRDDRLRSDDVVLKALRGDEESRAAVEAAASVWREAVSPALESLLTSISTSYGFVTSPVWDQEVARIRSASATIRGILDPTAPEDQATPVERTRRFWEACDALRTFLADLRNRSSEFFIRWDHRVMRHESCR